MARKKPPKRRAAGREDATPDPVAPVASDEPEEEHEAVYPIVGIGASAGGLEAFSEILENLPSHTGMGFVFVQHLDPKHAAY